jgi:beta-galactosidase
MIHLGTQYYRPPFPNDRYWEDDIKQMAASGLNTLQLWVVWAWVEAEPGVFQFDDYDRLVALAQKHGLEVVLSTIAAIHPYWIHREVPGSRMVDNFGHEVISSNRGECHYGLTPGGCIDHPGVWERMAAFIEAVGKQYRAAPNLAGWDAWNELRWNVQADGLVCYCDNTLRRFRDWLDAKYGGLEVLNAAWQRRYTAWDDVRPGKMPNRPYTEMMAFEDFISWRAVQHAYDRYDVLKGVDPDHPVTVHGGQPTVLHGSDSYPNATALHRGNDWGFSDRTDGVGCSSFPLWGGREMDRAEFISRIDYVASARQGQRVWLSELQGGRSNIGFNVAQSVDPASQQGWVWTGISAGADTILFWCWRDEVFGRESTGFGLAGNDGLAEARLAAMAKTGDVLKEHGDLLEAYEPGEAEVGIFFSPQSYYVYWAEEGTARKALDGIRGYAQALVRRNVPYRIVEEEHLGALAGLKLLILPRTVVMDAPVAEALADFVREGGVLFCESEVGAFGTNGLYRYPEDRFFADLTGVQEVGRRPLEDGTVSLSLNGATYEMAAAQWLTPLVERGDEPVPALLREAAVGRGRVLLCGTYLGDAYLTQHGDGARTFENFLLGLVADAGVTLPVTVAAPTPAIPGASRNDFVHVKVGAAGEMPVAFVFAPEPGVTVDLRFAPGTFSDAVTDLLTGQEIPVMVKEGAQQVILGPTEWGIAVLVGR